MSSQSNFLDKNSILALVCLGFVWLAWDFYMKSKYPPIEQAVQEAVVLKKQTSPEKALSFGKKYSETNSYLKFEQTQRGFGFSQLELRKFKNREGKPIQFLSQVKPFLALSIEGKTPLFKVKKQALGFKARYKERNILITAERVFNNSENRFEGFFEIETKDSFRPEVSLSFSAQPLNDAEKEESWYTKLLFFGGTQALSVFVKGEDETWWQGSELEEVPKKADQVSILALGDKYFGQAFILKKSDVFPKAFIEGGKKTIKAQLKWKLLNSNKLRVEYIFLVTPKALDYLEKQDVNLTGWINFGFFGWLARPLLKLLKLFYGFCGNWGLAICLLTLFVRFLLLPLNFRSYKSMKIMQNIQPQMQELRKRFAEDSVTLNKEIMSLMKENRASPLGGCLPMFFQFPVFFALYRVLSESVELYQAPFYLWIKDLSEPDPFYILPIVGGLVLFVQQKITPNQLPAAQAKLLAFMPILFSLFMLKFPSGLTLYIFVSSLFGLVQQFYFMKLNEEK